MNTDQNPTPADTHSQEVVEPAVSKQPALPPEIGGAPGPEPTRYGDWAHKGRCTDF